MHNVIKNAEGNFDRLSWKVVDDYGVAYDLGSALHYGAYVRLDTIYAHVF